MTQDDAPHNRRQWSNRTEPTGPPQIPSRLSDRLGRRTPAFLADGLGLSTQRAKDPGWTAVSPLSFAWLYAHLSHILPGERAPSI